MLVLKTKPCKCENFMAIGLLIDYLNICDRLIRKVLFLAKGREVILKDNAVNCRDNTYFLQE